MSGMKFIVAAAITAIGISGAAMAADSLGASFSAGKGMTEKSDLSSFRAAAKGDSTFGVKSTMFKGGDLFASSTIAKPGLVSKDASTFTITGGKDALKASEGFKVSK